VNKFDWGLQIVRPRGVLWSLLDSDFLLELDYGLACPAERLLNSRDDDQRMCGKIGVAGLDTRSRRLIKLGKIENDHRDTLPFQQVRRKDSKTSDARAC